MNTLRIVLGIVLLAIALVMISASSSSYVFTFSIATASASCASISFYSLIRASEGALRWLARLGVGVGVGLACYALWGLVDSVRYG